MPILRLITKDIIAALITMLHDVNILEMSKKKQKFETEKYKLLKRTNVNFRMQKHNV